MSFPAAPLDRSTQIITLGLVVALVGLVLSTPETEPIARAIAVAVAVGIVALAYGFAPKEYQLDASSLRVVRRLFGSRRFTLSGSIQRVSSEAAMGGIRLAGSGGLFGWYGVFWRRGTGRYYAYVTDRARLVACATPKGTVLVSPADPDAFTATATVRT